MDKMVAMETLVAVVESGSFSGAARVLNVGQPAVSKIIAQLEAELGVRLLIRSTRGLAPTEAGTNFYDHARRAIQAAEDAELAAKGASTDLSGRLRVSATVTFARMRVVPHLMTFLSRHPRLTVDLLLDDGNVDLLEQGIDVALRLGKLADSTMTARRIAQFSRMLVASPLYLARAGIPDSPRALGVHECVVYDRGGGGTAWSFKRDGESVDVDVAGRVRITAAEGVRAAVLAGMGLAVSTDWMFAPELASGEVVRVLPEWDLPAVDLWAVYPSGRLGSAKAKAFVSFVEETLKPPPVPSPAEGPQ
ncbi:LysR family transcriptional regulator [Cupriavidus sp. IDO]|uniref:LysR family transcriptional regulator n=1 Tax=Cupriavidus sp. IDO TaxID=1539142 RepID=UPI00057933E5|nr:LysR family transcriptional regulator [Cupriavidus sp. IDO]KWR90705.1 transcriptional regulator [Cupriavidus sp. IDO]